MNLRLATTVLDGRSPELLGSLFIGYKMGRLSLGVGLQLSETTVTSTFNGRSTTGSHVALLISPGLRAALVRAEGGRFELACQVDVGVGRTFGVSGPGASEVLGLPPGTSVSADRLHLSVIIGPVLRYWLHPQLAVETAVLGRADGMVVSSSSDTERVEVDLHILLGLRLMAVF